jgi:hypothetical protein
MYTYLLVFAPLDYLASSIETTYRCALKAMKHIAATQWNVQQNKCYKEIEFTTKKREAYSLYCAYLRYGAQKLAQIQSFPLAWSRFKSSSASGSPAACISLSTRSSPRSSSSCCMTVSVGSTPYKRSNSSATTVALSL